MHLMKKPAILLTAILASVFFMFATAKKSEPARKTETASAVNTVSKENSSSTNELFSALHLSEAGLSETVFNSAIQGMQKLEAKGQIRKDDVITIIDFSQPSTKKRLYILCHPVLPHHHCHCFQSCHHHWHCHG